MKHILFATLCCAVSVLIILSTSPQSQKNQNESKQYLVEILMSSSMIEDVDRTASIEECVLVIEDTFPDICYASGDIMKIRRQKEVRIDLDAVSDVFVHDFQDGVGIVFLPAISSNDQNYASEIRRPCDGSTSQNDLYEGAAVLVNSNKANAMRQYDFEPLLFGCDRDLF